VGPGNQEAAMPGVTLAGIDEMETIYYG